MLSLDYKMVDESEVSGQITAEQIQALMERMNVGDSSARALNYYSSLPRDESLTEEQRQRSLTEFFRDKRYIPKEFLRAVPTDIKPIIDANDERAARRYPFLNAAMLRST